MIGLGNDNGSTSVTGKDVTFARSIVSIYALSYYDDEEENDSAHDQAYNIVADWVL